MPRLGRIFHGRVPRLLLGIWVTGMATGWVAGGRRRPPVNHEARVAAACSPAGHRLIDPGF